MLAKFKGVVFKAEKIADMPGYFLYRGKQFVGSIFLDSMRFVVVIEQFDPYGTLSFDIVAEDFQLLDTE